MKNLGGGGGVKEVYYVTFCGRLPEIPVCSANTSQYREVSNLGFKLHIICITFFRASKLLMITFTDLDGKKLRNTLPIGYVYRLGSKVLPWIARGKFVYKGVDIIKTSNLFLKVCQFVHNNSNGARSEWRRPFKEVAATNRTWCCTVCRFQVK